MIKSSFFQLIDRSIHSHLKMLLGSLILKKRTQKECKKNKKPTKKACKIIQNDSLDKDDLYAALVRKQSNCEDDEDDEEDEDEADREEKKKKKHRNDDQDVSEDDGDSDEEKEDHGQEEKDNEKNSAICLISEKEQEIERRKDWETHKKTGRHQKRTGRHQKQTRKHQIKQQLACFLKTHLSKNYLPLSRL